MLRVSYKWYQSINGATICIWAAILCVQNVSRIVIQVLNSCTWLLPFWDWLLFEQLPACFFDSFDCMWTSIILVPSNEIAVTNFNSKWIHMHYRTQFNSIIPSTSFLCNCTYILVFAREMFVNYVLFFVCKFFKDNILLIFHILQLHKLEHRRRNTQRHIVYR